MSIVGKKLLEKHKRKNKGNTLLVAAIETLIQDLEQVKFKIKLNF